VIEYLPMALMEQGVAGRCGHGVLDGHQHAAGELGVVGVLDVAADRLDANLVGFGVEIARSSLPGRRAVWLPSGAP
jgi:hypothetical protein